MKGCGRKEDLRENVDGKGVDVVLGEKEEGWVYGMRLIEEKKGCVVNG